MAADSACAGLGCMPWRQHPFFDAAAEGDEVACVDMLRHNLALLKLRVSGRMYTPWHIAAENGRVGVLRVMANYIKHPEAPHILNTRIRRWMHLTLTGDRLLMSYAASESKGGYTPLMLAAKHGHVGVIEMLLELGVDVWQGDWHGLCALHHAALHNQCQVIHLLCSRSPDPPPRPVGFNTDTKYVDATDACGWTPLHYAAADGKLEAVRTLLSHGATLIARSQHHNLRSELLPTGLTPLHLAAYSGSLPVAKAILREYFHARADLVPSQTAHLSTQELLRRRRRAHPDPRLMLTRTGRLPFHFARRLRHTHMLEWLDPTIPLMFLFGGTSEEDADGAVLVGVPRLAVLAASVLHAKLTADLVSVQTQLEQRQVPAPAADTGEPDSHGRSSAAGKRSAGGAATARPSLLLPRVRVHPALDAIARSSAGGVDVNQPLAPHRSTNNGTPPAPGLLARLTPRVGNPTCSSAMGQGSRSQGGATVRGSSSGAHRQEQDVLHPGDGLGTLQRWRHAQKRTKGTRPPVAACELQDACPAQELRRMGLVIPHRLDDRQPVAQFLNQRLNPWEVRDRGSQPAPHGHANLNSTWHSGQSLCSQQTPITAGIPPAAAPVTLRAIHGAAAVRCSEPGWQGMMRLQAHQASSRVTAPAVCRVQESGPDTCFASDGSKWAQPMQPHTPLSLAMQLPPSRMRQQCPKADTGPGAGALVCVVGDTEDATDTLPESDTLVGANKQLPGSFPNTFSLPDTEKAVASGATNQDAAPSAADGVAAGAAHQEEKEKGEEEGEEEDCCPVCLDEVPNVLLAPCKHTVCLGCCKDLLRRHKLTPALCPYCRAVISGMSACPDNKLGRQDLDLP